MRIIVTLLWVGLVTSSSWAAVLSGRATLSSYVWNHTEIDSSETRHLQNSGTLGLKLARIGGKDLEITTTLRGSYDKRNQGDDMDDYRVHDLMARWKNLAGVADLTVGRQRIFWPTASVAVDGASADVDILNALQVGGYIGTLAPEDGHFRPTDYDEGHAFGCEGSSYDNGGAHNVAIAKGCVTCHMASLPDNTVAGGHSFAINYESGSSVMVNSKGCACHNWNDQTATTTADSYQAEFYSSLSELGDLLVARGWLNAAKTQVTINAAAPTTPEARGVVFNYLMLLQDKSGGVHNPRFAESVIAAAKTYLQSSAWTTGLLPAHGNRTGT